MLFCKDARARARARSPVRGTACAARCCRRRDYCPSPSFSSSPTILVPPLFLFLSYIFYCFLAPSPPCPRYFSFHNSGWRVHLIVYSYRCCIPIHTYVACALPVKSNKSGIHGIRARGNNDIKGNRIK